jgi:hypothetical protein
VWCCVDKVGRGGAWLRRVEQSRAGLHNGGDIGGLEVEIKAMASERSRRGAAGTESSIVV